MNESLTTLVQVKKDMIEIQHTDLGDVIWQLQEGVRTKVRIKKICGFGLTDGYVCAADPGAGTRHTGTGNCIQHEEAFIPRLLDVIRRAPGEEKKNKDGDVIGIQPRVIDIFEKAQNIDTRVFHTMDTEIQALYGLLEMQLSGLSGEMLNDKSSNSLQKLITSIAGLKKERQTFEAAQSLDMVVVKSLIEGVMQVVIANTNEVVARRILTEILNKVVKPMRASGTLTGSEGLPFADYSQVGEV